MLYKKIFLVMKAYEGGWALWFTKKFLPYIINSTTKYTCITKCTVAKDTFYADPAFIRFEICFTYKPDKIDELLIDQLIDSACSSIPFSDDEKKTPIARAEFGRKIQEDVTIKIVADFL